MSSLSFLPLSEIDRLRKDISDPVLRSSALADAFRINILYMIAQAGSGHIGSSFSSIDMLTYLWTEELHNPNTERSDSDVFFSSKGHDAPALYTVLIGLGRLDFNCIHSLRRLNGLPGHPDIATPGIVANTGSLGMGISKARGMAKARRLQGKKGRIFVLTGDGELQEGQFWESLQPTANAGYGEITVLVDHNKIQSDTLVSRVSDLGDLEKKLSAFGWEVARVNGHDVGALRDTLRRVSKVTDRPKIIVADTIKGHGVSFMELLEDTVYGPMYRFHSGAPKPDDYKRALEEILGRVNESIATLGLPPLSLETVSVAPSGPAAAPESLISAYSEELVKLGECHQELVVLDGDLALDTGVLEFHRQFPERFVECGIAEQDMVSMAGGLALQGMCPIVHSFACFLSARPNEQIYNNATERTKIIYVGSLAGLLPAGPGHSHQSVRDLSALGGVPGLTIVQPGDAAETRAALRWAVEVNKGSSYIRLNSLRLNLPYKIPSSEGLKEGCGTVLRRGEDLSLFTYGPVFLTEAIKAADMLLAGGIKIEVVNFPWLNRVELGWLRKALENFRELLVVDDHFEWGGLGQYLSSQVASAAGFEKLHVTRVSISGIPHCGRADEVLSAHGVAAQDLGARIRTLLGKG